MKRIQYLLPALFLLCLGCYKDKGDPADTGNLFEADIDGKHWQADSAGATFVYVSPNYGGNFFRLEGRSSSGQFFHLLTKSEAPSEATFAVTIVSFAAKFDLPNSNGVKLSWTTANEFHSDKFEVERSLDAISFSKVGEVQTIGNTSSNVNYEWVDKPPFADRYYYRLKEIDTAGASVFSKVLIITNYSFQYYFSSASDTAYHYGFNGIVTVTTNDTAAKRVSGTFQFDYVDDGTGTKHTVRNGKFTDLSY